MVPGCLLGVGEIMHLYFDLDQTPDPIVWRSINNTPQLLERSMTEYGVATHLLYENYTFGLLTVKLAIIAYLIVPGLPHSSMGKLNCFRACEMEFLRFLSHDIGIFY